MILCPWRHGAGFHHPVARQSAALAWPLWFGAQQLPNLAHSCPTKPSVVELAFSGGEQNVGPASESPLPLRPPRRHPLRLFRLCVSPPSFSLLDGCGGRGRVPGPSGSSRRRRRRRRRRGGPPRPAPSRPQSPAPASAPTTSRWRALPLPLSILSSFAPDLLNLCSERHGFR